MKNRLLTWGLCALFALAAGEATAQQKAPKRPPLKPLPRAAVAQTHLGGYLGHRIDGCIRVRVMSENPELLTAPFRRKDEKSRWQTEFWGKWTLGACAAYAYNGDPELLRKIKQGVDGLLSTQEADGYIGNYAPEARLTNWDVWGCKYTLLGLLAYYDISNDKKVLEGALRLADWVLEQIPARQRIVKAGLYRGMPPSSILEPIVYVYQRTGHQKYLDFAHHIVNEWETPDGPQLIAKALAGAPVADRFPVAGADDWWGWENGQKAYEMMSCYDGLLELYRITKNPDHLKAAELTARNIIAEEINNAGTGAAYECWYHGRRQQTTPAAHTMETCVTMTWMKFCAALLEATGDPVFADQIERTAYNALQAALKEDFGQVAMYTPLEGLRYGHPGQCDMHLNCCNANAPRAFMLLPGMAVTQTANALRFNLYGSSTGKATVAGTEVLYEQRTSYPEEGSVDLLIKPRKPTEFTVALRIPAWSAVTMVAVNGQTVADVKPGAYLKLDRNWKEGDKITLRLDMRGRLTRLNGYQAVERGPVVLARDSRFGEGFVDEAVRVKADGEGYVELLPTTEKPEKIWMAFTAPMEMSARNGAEVRVTLCDFGSAGNTWNATTRYRVWLPRTLDAIKDVPPQH